MKNISETECKRILYTSDDAAKFVTNISGWVDRHGNFWGKAEDSARYSGCTHKACPKCGNLTAKGYLVCADCREKKAIEIYNKKEKKEWDGNLLLYSDGTGDYFAEQEDVEDYVAENGCTLESLRLVICDSVQLRKVDEDYWCDDLPDDCEELPEAVLEALKELNAVIVEAAPVSWIPGDFAAILQIKG